MVSKVSHRRPLKYRQVYFDLKDSEDATTNTALNALRRSTASAAAEAEGEDLHLTSSPPPSTSSSTSSSSLAHQLGRSLDAAPCLVLNSDYTPLSFIPLSLWDWRDSLRAILADKATVVSSYHLEIRSVHSTFTVPSVIALKLYHALPNNTPAMSRRNIYIRDDLQCQYCITHFTTKDLTLDHVLPRSKGGRLTWTNTVSACSPCNYKKGNKELIELHRLGMLLKSSTPSRTPSHYELQNKARKYRCKVCRQGALSSSLPLPRDL